MKQEPKFLCNTCINCLRIGVSGSWEKIYFWFCLLINKNIIDVIKYNIIECSKFEKIKTCSVCTLEQKCLDCTLRYNV